MEISVRGLLQNIWQPQLQFVRYKGKVNITKPRPPHFKRAVMETLCIPYFEEKKRPSYIPNYDLCVPSRNKIEQKEVHPLELILAKETFGWFNDSKMIAFFHHNSLSHDEKFQNQLRTKKNGMKLTFLKNDIVKRALKGTIFETLTKIYEGPTATIFSPETDINTLLSLSKKLQKLVLLAAVVDDRLLSYSELTNYGKFKNLAEAQSTLLMTLNLIPQGIVQQITHHPNHLVGLLNERKKLLKDGD